MNEPARMPSDELLRRAQQDREQLGDLLDRYRAYLRVLAQRQVGGTLSRRVDGSDIVQQTMLEAQRAFADFRGATDQEFMIWLTQILNHNVRDFVRDHLQTAKRAAGREQSLENETLAWKVTTSEQSSPSQRAMRGESAAELASLLETLPADQREAVRLRHLEGWSLAAIAEHMERSVVATAGLIKRGLQTLRRELNP